MNSINCLLYPLCKCGETVVQREMHVSQNWAITAAHTDFTTKTHTTKYFADFRPFSNFGGFYVKTCGNQLRGGRTIFFSMG